MSLFNPLKILWTLLKWAVVLFLATSVLAVLYYKWRPVRLTPLMAIRCVQQITRGEKPRCAHHWVPLDSMTFQLPIAVIASEDQNYMKHHGFDFEAIGQAYKEQKQGKRRRGGSTISQQTAKNVFLWPASSWTRKALEAYFTVLIEALWSKERIMEVYLNSIETGPGIYGAEAVARLHFGCSAAELRRSECALIAATLPAPLKYSSLHPSPYMRKRQRQIKRQMGFVSVRPWKKE